jgi:hypothetical protein
LMDASSAAMICGRFCSPISGGSTSPCTNSKIRPARDGGRSEIRDRDGHWGQYILGGGRQHSSWPSTARAGQAAETGEGRERTAAAAASGRTYRPRSRVLDLRVRVLQRRQQEGEPRADERAQRIDLRALQDTAKREGGRLAAPPLLAAALPLDVLLQSTRAGGRAAGTVSAPARARAHAAATLGGPLASLLAAAAAPASRPLHPGARYGALPGR